MPAHQTRMTIFKMIWVSAGTCAVLLTRFQHAVVIYFFYYLCMLRWVPEGQSDGGGGEYHLLIHSMRRQRAFGWSGPHIHLAALKLCLGSEELLNSYWPESPDFTNSVPMSNTSNIQYLCKKRLTNCAMLFGFQSLKCNTDKMESRFNNEMKNLSFHLSHGGKKRKKNPLCLCFSLQHP